ncbi:MAG: carboxylesterase/lipase family protein [Deltaproteobacteria bacterium]|nr:carboxylesterase/lipase family protein [Deltaproteobacteria bacterium]MBW2414080.1 carboxylesterase/lipase family protein [Deltaproteobacteria bacterium]
MIVSTRAGKLRGVRGRRGLVFKGIRYARSLEGGRRFAPPEPVAPWQGVREAAHSSLACPQRPPVQLPVRGMIGVLGGEHGPDCLALDVWTPAVDGRHRPVLVWIHGGAFVMGQGSTRLYSGRRLSQRGDVVVVTINYRLGALGYLDLTSIDRGWTANVGVRDQIAALEWVRDNIDAFGGDPDNVTIFGESAGGMSVGTLLGTPAARGLFHRAIAQSGAAHNVSSPERAAQVAESFLERLGIRGSDRGALEKVDMEKLLDAQRETTISLGLRSGGMPWQPSVDGDLLPGPPLEAIAKGLSRDIPLLVGTNRDEWNLFGFADVRRLDEDGLKRRFERALPGVDERGAPLAGLAFDAYRSAGRSKAPRDRWAAFMTDRIFRYPALRLAEAQVEHSARTYSYLFGWRPPLLPGRVGACHGLEIPFVFGTLLDPLLRPTLGTLGGARRLSEAMQDAWVMFARSGDPSHPSLPSWPAFDGGTQATMFLTRRPKVREGAFETARRFWGSLP